MNDLDLDKFCQLAIDKGVPWWAAEEIIPEFKKRHIERIESCADQQKEIRYLCKVFPELKHKIKYRYEKKFKSDRSLFKNRLRTLLRTNLQNNGIQARTLTSSMIEFLLGYSIEDIMSHIENQFTAKMTWENHGKVWHLDHIYPCSRLRYKSATDNNFKRLWSLNNLRPLCAKENIAKSNNVTGCGENG